MVDLSWWKRLTATERGLTVITFSVVLFCIASAIAIGVLSRESCDNETDQPHFHAVSSGLKSTNLVRRMRRTCRTSTCLSAAAKIHGNMNKTVNPCDNFYKFACGNFHAKTTIPDSMARVNALTQITAVLQLQLRKSIEGPDNPRGPKFMRLVKNLYRSCMNTKSIETRGVKPLLAMLKQLGGWPVLEGTSWNQNDFHWIELIYKFRDIGLPIDLLIGFNIANDMKDSAERKIYIDQPTLGISHEFFVGDQGKEIVDAYYDYMVKVAVLLGAPLNVAKEELIESLEFERELAKISSSTEKHRAIIKLYHPMDINRLSTAYPIIPWRNYLNRLLAPKTRIQKNEKIIVTVPQYLSKFPNVIKNVSPRVQANYMMWRVVAASIRYLNEDLRRIQLEFEMKISGEPARESRWRECTQIVSNRIPLGVSSLYVKNYFNEKAKINAAHMSEAIKRELKTVLRRVKWMDRYTRRNALRKASAMTYHIAYPHELLNHQKLNQFYHNLELTDVSYLNNALNVSRFNSEHAVGELRKRVNKMDWKAYGNAALVNAYYTVAENSIQIPAAILQGSLFNQYRPKYMNYGGIGFIIGHEITHGFDENGRYFDHHGNAGSWWSPSAIQKYEDEVKCIINQYGNYIVPEIGLRLNGLSTRNENIADNGGTKLAYLAYRRWAAKHAEEQQLPGLNYSPKQMFWLSSASARCSKYRPELLKNMIINHRHSPSEFRIIGPFSNMIEFARDFKCGQKTKMNPIKKCTVW